MTICFRSRVYSDYSNKIFHNACRSGKQKMTDSLNRFTNKTQEFIIEDAKKNYNEPEEDPLLDPFVPSCLTITDPVVGTQFQTQSESIFQIVDTHIADKAQTAVSLNSFAVCMVNSET
ncbi:hypothetical protein Glove_193g25 [Diversispora epigaea]|uniref:Uncharacterized protein n=1 Tax=Diversispora epigaea TaxID=1348612 RepID=A0A397IPR2_9GLOM|nr:hypothetical protein Glove_193g25 [Diversispora epigaea]